MPQKTPENMSETRKPGKKNKVENAIIENIPAYEPNIPVPTCRADLIKYWLNLSLDDKTAHRSLWITEGGAKVAHMTDTQLCPVLDHPKRYEHSPQVLTKEGIKGYRGYWEVEYAGWLVAGAAYEGAARRSADGACGLGENDKSWGVGWSGSCYQAWHDGQNKDLTDVAKCSVLGMYLDQPAGILNIYSVVDVKEGDESKKEVVLLHQFRAKFQEKMFPGFWLGTDTYCLLKKKEE